GHVRKSVFRIRIDAATVGCAEGGVPRWVARLTSDVSGSPPDPVRVRRPPPLSRRSARESGGGVPTSDALVDRGLSFRSENLYPSSVRRVCGVAPRTRDFTLDGPLRRAVRIRRYLRPVVEITGSTRLV